MEKRIRVCFCTDGIYPQMMGGMQKHSRLLCESLADFSDIELFVIHPHGEGKVFNDNRISEIFIPGIKQEKNYLIETYKYSKRVHNKLKSINPDIIYSQGLSVWHNASEFSEKLIINPHGLEPYQAIGLKNRLLAIPFRIIFAYLFKKASVVISLGGRLTEILNRIVSFPSRIEEIPNAINLPKGTASRSFDKQVFKGLFLARFAHNKGIDVLFESINGIDSSEYSNKFEFILGGKGPLFDYYNGRKNPVNVKLLGFVADEKIPDLYQDADFFVFPTLFEGMPTVVLEAMSYGLPVIVSDVGATKVLVDELNGKIITPGSVLELTEAIKWFYELQPDEKMKLSIASYRKVVGGFTWPKVAQMHHDLFFDVAQKNRLS